MRMQFFFTDDGSAELSWLSATDTILFVILTDPREQRILTLYDIWALPVSSQARFVSA